MQALRRKLKNRQGASMLMAMLLLLVAVMVSAVVLAAAISAARDVRNDRALQQSLLTVSSAAELVRDSVLCGSGNYEKTLTKTYSSYQNYYWDWNPTTTTHVTKASGPFSQILNEAIEACAANPAQSFDAVYTISGEGVEPVRAEFLMRYEKKDETSGEGVYTLTVRFCAAEDTAHACRMALTMSGDELVQKKDFQTSLTRTVTTTLRWTADGEGSGIRKTQ